ncbi:MAG: cytochrome C oxidase subunit IV family protein [Fidelibacterota bacterium]|jgi:cytochrome c oxidase subunit 4|tara:strand:- start:967 stop:1272 length:306 start_codon:yes stop_codon:yes gene_type:complete
MSSDSHKSVEEQVKIYLNVFGALLVLTGVTVAVSYLDVSFIEAFFIAIVIATIKGSLVLGFFMHLISERQAVIWILISTFIAFLILMFLPLVSMTDHTNIW